MSAFVILEPLNYTRSHIETIISGVIWLLLNHVSGYRMCPSGLIGTDLGSDPILTIMRGICKNWSEITDLGSDPILTIMRGICKNWSEITDLGSDPILTIMRGICKKWSEITDLGSDRIITIISGICKTGLRSQI
jgi:hypothetical protein